MRIIVNCNTAGLTSPGLEINDEPLARDRIGATKAVGTVQVDNARPAITASNSVAVTATHRFDSR